MDSLLAWEIENGITQEHVPNVVSSEHHQPEIPIAESVRGRMPSTSENACVGDVAPALSCSTSETERVGDAAPALSRSTSEIERLGNDGHGVDAMNGRAKDSTPRLSFSNDLWVISHSVILVG